MAMQNLKAPFRLAVDTPGAARYSHRTSRNQKPYLPQ
jgi:hypothetical protein